MNNVDTMTIKSILKTKKISVRSLAKQVKSSVAVVSDILNNKYKGSPDTIKTILKKINFVLLDKVDLNELIYSNSETYEKVFMNLFRDKKYSADEAEKFYSVFQILKKFNDEKNKIQPAQESH